MIRPVVKLALVTVGIVIAGVAAISAYASWYLTHPPKRAYDEVRVG